MKNLYILPLLLTTINSYAHDYHNLIHNSMVKSTFSYSSFSNSKQKRDSKSYSLSLHSKIAKHKIEMMYRYSHANTLQPPLKSDLFVDKVFGRYSYDIGDNDSINMSMMYINDNLVPTDQGEIYGLGYTHKSHAQYRLILNQYWSIYDDFSVNQSDINLQLHHNIGETIIDLNLMAKYITLDGYSNKIFNPKSSLAEPDDEYLSFGVKLHTAYESYHAGVGAFWGDRVFAVMNNGFNTQHHAMRFTQGYFLTIGKKIGAINLIAKYSHQKADELPMDNMDIEVDSYSLLLNYKF